jgi:hypothetical protein
MNDTAWEPPKDSVDSDEGRRSTPGEKDSPTITYECLDQTVAPWASLHCEALNEALEWLDSHPNGRVWRWVIDVGQYLGEGEQITDKLWILLQARRRQCVSS